MLRTTVLLCSLGVTPILAQGPNQPASPTGDPAGSPATPTQGGRPSLTELAAIAKERAEKLRPRQIAALEPFLSDLALDYASNEVYLRKRLVEVAGLGDGIVPLLLENLAKHGDGPARNRAANSRRVLANLEPASFVDELIQIAGGEDRQARGHARELLGLSDSRAARTFLADQLASTQGDERLEIIESLRALGAAQAAPQVAASLSAESPALRQAAAAFLADNPDPSVLDAVLAALPKTRDPKELMPLVDYLGSAATGSAPAADALVPLFQIDTIDRQQLATVARSLGKIAPPEHAPTIAACKRVLEEEEDTGELGRACMLTMQDLGDKSGIKILLDNLKTRINRNRRTAEWRSRRGEAYLALGEWQKAASDYEEAIKLTRGGLGRQLLYLRVALCEAERGRWRNVVKAWKEGGTSRSSIQREAAAHPAIRTALEQRSVQRYLDSLPQ